MTPTFPDDPARMHRFDPAMTDIEHLRKAIEDGGYEAI